ncbi:MAG: peptidase M23 [Marinilabiliales bacterium]|nr:MAG: peptidase M23 [Marinilabiliales bacterium]
MFKQISILLLSLLLFSQYVVSQSYPSKYFRSPLGIPLYLSGTFGELRTNHFHSGIDIKTQGTEGKNVYAIADGYVSRIKVSTSGYGKVLYITHPNGYVSVYGHLKMFNAEIQKYIIDLQYEKENFEVESFPGKDKFKIKKGDVIAFSGNTGGSMGPHLHFEIREEASQYPVNPLLFKSIKIKDFTRPQIKGLAIYPADENASVNGKNDTLYIPVEGWGENHRLKNNQKIIVNGNISFGIRAYDKMNEINNKNGIYSLDLNIDTVKSFGIKMTRLSFSTSRYINTLMDYGFFVENSLRYIRTTIDTNNRLFIYNDVKNNGIYTFDDTLRHEIEFVVKDAYDNFSKLRFVIKSGDSLVEKKPNIKIGKSFLFSKNNEINTANIKADFPANTFYRSLDFIFDSIEGENTYSPVYLLHNNKVAVQKHFKLSIKHVIVDEKYADKLYIAYSPDNEEYFYMGNDYSKEYISARTRLLGYFTIMADTVSPIIKSKNITDLKSVATQKTIQMIIKDKDTGIKSYNSYLNGKWILMEYDAKNNLLTYQIDDHLKKGKNNFRLEVEDLLSNKSVYEAVLIR